MQKILTTFLVLVLLSQPAWAGKWKVPFTCYEKEIIEEFRKEGIILDKTDPASHGHIENWGSSYYIVLKGYPKDEYIRLFVEVPLRVETRMREQNNDNDN